MEGDIKTGTGANYESQLLCGPATTEKAVEEFFAKDEGAYIGANGVLERAAHEVYGGVDKLTFLDWIMRVTNHSGLRTKMYPSFRAYLENEACGQWEYLEKVKNRARNPRMEEAAEYEDDDAMSNVGNSEESDIDDDNHGGEDEDKEAHDRDKDDGDKMDEDLKDEESEEEGDDAEEESIKDSDERKRY